jgi:hypothetical protein
MGKGTPHFPGREARASSLIPAMAITTGLKHLHPFRRSSVVLAASFIVLIPLQHGSGTDGPGFIRYSIHSAVVCIISSHEREALANGMPKTKHVTTKQVTLMRIELAMNIDFEMRCTL